MNSLPGNSLPATAITAPTPAPLHDIIGPFSFFDYTQKEISIAVGLLLLLLGFIAWIIWKKYQKPPLTPSEVALRDLAAMKESLMKGSDHDFGILVSGLLRRYLSETFGLAAPQQTTEEFLASLCINKSFPLPEQESLAIFLKHSDLLKFAGGKARDSDRLALITAAEDFVIREKTVTKSTVKQERTES